MAYVLAAFTIESRCAAFICACVEQEAAFTTGAPVKATNRTAKAVGRICRKSKRLGRMVNPLHASVTMKDIEAALQSSMRIKMRELSLL